MSDVKERLAQGIRSAQAGLWTNAALVVVKILAGIFGHSYALVADGIESGADVFSSLIVWGGLRISGRSPDDEFHFGYGKAESLAAALVSMMLLGAALGIAVEAIREILTPHHLPAGFTLIVLVGVIVVKAFLFRRVFAVAVETESTAVKTDASHHRADVVTSSAAFIGISIALIGGQGWEAADDYAALIASLIIAWNGVSMLRTVIDELMDRAPDPEILETVRKAAEAVPGVSAIEKLKARRAGLTYFIDLHVQADPRMSLYDAHYLSGSVKWAIQRQVPTVAGVLIHMEPYDGSIATDDGPHPQ